MNNRSSRSLSRNKSNIYGIYNNGRYNTRAEEYEESSEEHENHWEDENPEYLEIEVYDPIGKKSHTTTNSGFSSDNKFIGRAKKAISIGNYSSSEGEWESEEGTTFGVRKGRTDQIQRNMESESGSEGEYENEYNSPVNTKIQSMQLFDKENVVQESQMLKHTVFDKKKPYDKEDVNTVFWPNGKPDPLKNNIIYHEHIELFKTVHLVFPSFTSSGTGREFFLDRTCAYCRTKFIEKYNIGHHNCMWHPGKMDFQTGLYSCCKNYSYINLRRRTNGCTPCDHTDINDTPKELTDGRWNVENQNVIVPIMLFRFFAPLQRTIIEKNIVNENLSKSYITVTRTNKI